MSYRPRDEINYQESLLSSIIFSAIFSSVSLISVPKTSSFSAPSHSYSCSSICLHPLSSTSYVLIHTTLPGSTKRQMNVLQEVDEENIEDDPTTQSTAVAASKSELDINSKFDEFWRAGREKAKEKKLRRAKELRKSESDAVDAPASTTTSAVITAAPSVTTSPPRSNIIISSSEPRPSL